MKTKRRNIGLTALLTVCALVLTACEFRIHTDLVIEEDGSGVLSLEMSVDEQLAGLAESGMGMDMMDMGEIEIMGEGEGPIELIDDGWVPDGWTIEVVSDGYQGIRASTEFDDLDGLEQRLRDLAAEDGADIPMTTGAGGMLSGMSLGQEGDVLVFELEIPEQPGAMFEGMDEMEGDVPVDLSALDEVFDIRFTLTLPGEIVTERTNADLITGQTLVWNLSVDDGGRVLEAQSQLPRSGASMIIVWAVAALALAAAVYLVIDRRRRQAAAAPAAPESADPAEVPAPAEAEETSPEDS